MLDNAGYTDAKICLSNGLNEFTIKDLLEQGAEVDTFGVGDNLTAPNDRLGGVYKLVAVEDNGEGIEFNVFVYNVQPGIVIDYATGESYAE